MALTLPCHARVNTEFDRRGMIVTCDAGKQVCPKQERQYLLAISCFSNGNPSVVSQSLDGAKPSGANGQDASPEPDGSVGGRRSECEGVRDESPKDTSGGSPTTVKAGCKDSRREGGESR
jgi:hypothetical protein